MNKVTTAALDYNICLEQHFADTVLLFAAESILISVLYKMTRGCPNPIQAHLAPAMTITDWHTTVLGYCTY